MGEQNDYLPNFYSRQIIQVISCVLCQRLSSEELMLNYLAKITLIKSVANQFGNVSSPMVFWKKTTV